MQLRRFILFFSLLFACAYAKPLVVLAPIVNRTDAHYGWSLEKEFTERLYEELKQHNEFKLIKGKRYDKRYHDPFLGNVHWVKDHYPRADFVAFAELIQHDAYAKKPSKQSDRSGTTAKLCAAFRIRVFDVRDAKPRIVLQEVVQKSSIIPFLFSYSDTGDAAWSDPRCTPSSLDSIHDKLTREVAKRIEHYIQGNCKTAQNAS